MELNSTDRKGMKVHTGHQNKTPESIIYSYGFTSITQGRNPLDMSVTETTPQG